MSSMRLAKRALSTATRQHRLPVHRYSRAASTSAAHDEDPQLGGYPDIWQNNQTLPPRGWWDQQMRRNFGDPVSAPMRHVARGAS